MLTQEETNKCVREVIEMMTEQDVLVFVANCYAVAYGLTLEEAKREILAHEPEDIPALITRITVILNRAGRRCRSRHEPS